MFYLSKAKIARGQRQLTLGLKKILLVGEIISLWL